MTDKKIDQLLEAALIPEISDEDIKLTPKKSKRKNMIKLRRILCVAASVVVVALIGTGIWGAANPVLASKLPLIGNIFSLIQDNLSFSGNYADKAQTISAGPFTAESSGVTIAASEVYSDGYSVYLTMTVASDKFDFSNIPLTKTNTDPGAEKTVYCMSTDIEATIDGDSVFDISSNMTLEGDIEDNTFYGAVKLDMNTDFQRGITKDIVFKISITGLGYDDKQLEHQTSQKSSVWIDGDWELSIPLHIDKTASRVIELSKSVGEITLDKVVITDYQVLVYAYNQLPQHNFNIDEIDAEIRDYIKSLNPGADDDEICRIYKKAFYPENEKTAPVVAYDNNGNSLKIVSESSNGLVRFSIKEQDVSTLQIFVLPDDLTWFSVYKGGNITDAKELSVIAETITIE